MNVNQKKLERQEQGVTKWINAKAVGICDYATGVGKTFLAILAMKRLDKMLRGSFVILVPSDALRIQWNTELEKHLPKLILERVSIKTIHELLVADMRIECTTLIIDEIHEFSTDDRITVLTKYSIEWKYLLGLTASADDKNFFKITMHIPVIDRITEEEARELGFISDFVEYNLSVVFTQTEREEYDRYSKIIESLLNKFQGKLEYAQYCLNGGKDKHKTFYSGLHWAEALAAKNGWTRYLDLNIPQNREIDDNWAPNVIINNAVRLMRAVRERKSILLLASNKYTTTLEILKKLKTVKTIVFSESNDFADRLYTLTKNNDIKSVVYHSGLKTKMVTSEKSGKLVKFGKVRQRKEALDAIRTGRVSALLTSKSLDRGLDVPDIRVGITTSGTKNPTQYKQRGGRVKRLEANLFGENITVLLINIYVANTQELNWLKNRQKDAKHSITWIESIDKIDYIPPSNPELVNKLI